MDKVLKFRREGDDERLLKMGEILLEYIDKMDERIVRVFCDMFKVEGKYGRRFRRRDGVYLFWEIIGGIDEGIFDFALNMFFRIN